MYDWDEGYVYVYHDVWGVHALRVPPGPDIFWVAVPLRLWSAYVYKELGGHQLHRGDGVPPVAVEPTAADGDGSVAANICWGLFLPRLSKMRPDEVVFTAKYELLSARVVDNVLGFGAYESIKRWGYWPNPTSL